MSVAVLIIAATLILVAAGLVVRADWAVLPRGGGAFFERLWVILPAAFLVLLIVMSARQGWGS